MDEEVRITLRLPASLRDKLQESADENNRSMNGEIISLLEVALWDAERAAKLTTETTEATTVGAQGIAILQAEIEKLSKMAASLAADMQGSDELAKALSRPTEPKKGR